MSVQGARSFVARLFKDKAFEEKISKIPTAEGKMKAAKEAGFDFTQQDMEKLLPKGVTLDQLRKLKPNQELPDEVLEAVSGGSKSDWEDFGIELGVAVAAEIIGAAAAAAI